MGLEHLKKLGYGTLHLPILDPRDQSSFDYEVLNRAIDMFLEHGFKYFDTSYIYHDRKAELALRECLVKRHPRDSYILSDKLPVKFMHCKEDVERIFNEQLEKCGVEYFDYYLLHSINSSAYDDIIKWEAFEFLRRKKAEGKFREIGVSLHDRPEFLERVLSEHPEIDFVVLQLNFVDWDNQMINARKTHQIARKYGKPIVVMQPCKGGTLLENLPEEALKLMRDHAPDASVVSWALRFAASQEGVRVVLSSYPELKMLEENIAVMENFKPLDEEEYKILEKVSQIIRDNTAIACSGCKYCILECPKHIPIDEYFALYNDAVRNAKSTYDSPFQSSADIYYMNISMNHGRASDCIKCRRCEKACPQGIKITEQLKKVAERFDNFDLNSALKPKDGGDEQ